MADRPTLDQEVLHWLRRRVGELMGRTGEAAIAAAPSAARLVLLKLGMPDLDTLEAAIATRWGVSLTLGASTDTIRDIAGAIVAGMQRKAAA
ncbi:hypothetical protein [Roseomonas genomospecies 6]|uniref:Uncharacterized protein n=1 Tax=Roseomonas genomospecies 6 TaxID=214106 RepID=A0A9W7NET2_9PROT|nr:hypothetical protein [Roseomonas genomospecies 6]KAA0678101.1 hypothetical protein DS843_21195 [Roseomonas genomospecies 6]